MSRVYYMLQNEQGEPIAAYAEIVNYEKALDDARSLVYDEGPVIIVRCEEISKVSIKVEEV